MPRIDRAALCTLVLAALLAAGCGDNNGENKADAGSTQTDRPRRGYEQPGGCTGEDPCCKGEDAYLTDLDGMTCAEAQEAYNTYQSLVLQCSTEELEGGECNVPKTSPALWQVESYELANYQWSGTGATGYQGFNAEMSIHSPRFPR